MLDPNALPHLQEQKIEQKQSIFQRILKMAERIFLQEQVKKREHRLQELHNEREEEQVRVRREKRSLWKRIRGRRRETSVEIIGESPATGLKL